MKHITFLLLILFLASGKSYVIGQKTQDTYELMGGHDAKWIAWQTFNMASKDTSILTIWGYDATVKKNTKRFYLTFISNETDSAFYEQEESKAAISIKVVPGKYTLTFRPGGLFTPITIEDFEFKPGESISMMYISPQSVIMKEIINASRNNNSKEKSHQPVIRTKKGRDALEKFLKENKRKQGEE